MKELQMVSKESALELISKAKEEIATNGNTSLNLVINRRHKEHSIEELVEVGILVDKSEAIPSSKSIMSLKRGDTLLEAIFSYEELLKEKESEEEK